MDRQSLRKQVDELFSAHKYGEIESVLTEYNEIAKLDKDLLKIYYLIPVCTAERESGEQTLFTKVSSVETLVERETILKFYLRRIAFDLLDNEEDFYEFCKQNRVSLAELFIVTYCNAVRREKVQDFIQRKRAEGKLTV